MTPSSSVGGPPVQKYVFINAFRALAAFWVLAAHCMIWGGWDGVPVPSAKLAVDLFMMITGFLMAANAFARDNVEPLSSSWNWLRFWLRRFFRIAPAYYLSLVLAAVTARHFLGGYEELRRLTPERWMGSSVYDPMRISYTWQNLVWHFSFLFGLHPSRSFSTFLPDWSLSLEMQFYFVFPALFLVLRRYEFGRVAVIIGVLSTLVGMGVARVVHYYEPSLLFFKLQYFIVGILVFYVLCTPMSHRRRLGFTAGAMFLVALEVSYARELIVLPILLLAMLVLGWLEVADRTPSWLSVFTKSRLVQFASDASYSVYLFHGFFISASGTILASHSALRTLTPSSRVLVIFLFVIGSSYLAGYVVYRSIELPGIHLGRMVLQKLNPGRQTSKRPITDASAQRLS